MEQRELVKTVIQELRQKKEQVPLQPTSNIDMVWVVSLPGTVLTPSQDGIYKGELADREVVFAGADLVRQITALRLNKKAEEITKEDVAENGPLLYYNGENLKTGKYAQNEDLAKLVATPEFPIPESKVKIMDIAENNTPGQVKQLAEFLHDDNNAAIRKIAVVGSSPHQRRTARYITHHRNLFPDNITFLDASVPPTTHQVGKTLREVRKIPLYFEKGHLVKEPEF